MGEVTLQNTIDGGAVLLRFKPNRRAKRYILRLARDGAMTVTIPRFGSQRDGRAFADRHLEWIQQQLSKFASRKTVDRSWRPGTQILLNGEPLPIRVEPSGATNRVLIGDKNVAAHVTPDSDLRPAVERSLWRMARKLLPARVVELSAMHGFSVQKVSVRNQRSRWGSCSRRGTISLNWRLVQAPPLVRDYIILHELAHLRHMNHSERFWDEVGKLCPEFEAAEAWLKTYSARLR